MDICDSAGRLCDGHDPPARHRNRRAHPRPRDRGVPGRHHQRNTARSYRTALRALNDWLGAHQPLSVLEGARLPDRAASWFTATWGTAAPATFNARLNALAAAVRWWHEQGWLSGDPLIRIQRRARTPDRTRAVDRAEIERLLTAEHLALRERTLWRLLYESAACATEVLSLDVGDLNTANRRAKVRRKGGAADVITWRTATARLLPRLLPRLLAGRRDGPVFLTDRRARVQLAPIDLDPATGRARLSYRRAAELFECASGGATLHQLRHSALTHAAEDGANTAVLLSYSGHTSVTSLARYARVSAEALAAWPAGRDPATRRH